MLKLSLKLSLETPKNEAYFTIFNFLNLCLGAVKRDFAHIKEKSRDGTGWTQKFNCKTFKQPQIDVCRN